MKYCTKLIQKIKQIDKERKLSYSKVGIAVTVWRAIEEEKTILISWYWKILQFDSELKLLRILGLPILFARTLPPRRGENLLNQSSSANFFGKQNFLHVLNSCGWKYRRREGRSHKILIMKRSSIFCDS